MFKPHRRHCVVSLSKNINPCLVLAQPRKTPPFLFERLLMGRRESNQTNKLSVILHGSYGLLIFLKPFSKKKKKKKIGIQIRISNILDRGPA